MRKRFGLWGGALLALVVVLAGCTGTARDREEASQEAQAVVALRMPLLALSNHREEMIRKLEAGDDKGAREAYAAFAAAFGEVLGPVSLQDPKLAQEMANANSSLKELFAGKQVDRSAAARHSDVIVQATHRAADALGLSLAATAAGQVGDTAQQKARTFTVEAKEYRLTPALIEVAKGTRVTIIFKNVGTEKHEFELEAFGKEIEPIHPGTTAQITFVADKAGTFEYACRVDDHYEKGMKGFLKVQ